MEVSEAVDQISAIHEYLSRGEVYRGFRPVPVALSGLPGLAPAAFQPRFLPADDALGKSTSLIPLLPGLWAILFGLGVFSARPMFFFAQQSLRYQALCASETILAHTIPEGAH